jgi:hypothetical protein
MTLSAIVARDRYEDVISTRDRVPIYFQPWWLDSLTWSGKWLGLVIEDGSAPVAVWPFVLKRKGPFTIITLPPLTPYLGPLIFYPPAQRHARRLSLETAVVRAALAAMPKHDAITVQTVPEFSNALPFLWEGFQATVGYTYRVDLREPALLNVFEPNARNKVRKASKTVEVSGLEPNEFYKLLRLTFERQSLSPPFTQKDFLVHDEAVATAGRRRIFGARNSAGVHSGLYLTWSDDCAYVHLVGEDPHLRKSGAGILLVYQAMLFARDGLGLRTFDFEGSSIESVEYVRRECGGRQAMCLHFRRYNSTIARLGASLLPTITSLWRR